MLNIKRGVVILALCLVTACGGGGGGGGGSGSSGSDGNSGGSSSNSGEDIDVSGRWSGTWSSSVFFSNGDFSLKLNQNGSSFTGSASFIGSNCFFGSSVSGSVSGNRMNFGFVDSSGNRANFSGSATSSSMNGTYKVTSGFCAGDEGTFSATRG